MSKRKGRPQRTAPVTSPQRRNSPQHKTLVAIALLLTMGLAVTLAVGLTRWRSSNQASLSESTLALTPQSSSSPANPSKEYIYVGGRLVATEGPLPPTGVGDGASFSAQTVPNSMLAGQIYNVSITMTNTGTNSWDTSYALGSQNSPGGLWGVSSVPLPSPQYVFPNNQAVFSFNVTAPSAPGAYNFQWQMVRNGNDWFGSQSASVQVTVTAPSGTTTESVNWTNRIGANAAPTANGLTKSAAFGWGNAGASSTRALSSGNGYVEFTATETSLSRMCGLSNADTDQSWQDIDYAIYVAYDQTIELFESGVYRGDFGTYAAGDRFRVAAEGGLVKYYKISQGNTQLLYTSGIAPAYPLVVDTALAHTNATLTNVVISGTLQNAPPNVSWTSNTTNVTPNGNSSLTKNAGSSAAWDGGAVSTRALSGGDGYLEFTASETSTDRIVGFSNSGAVPNYWAIDFGLRQYYGSLYIIESNGANLGNFGSYAPGDRLRISIEGGLVKYYKITQGSSQLLHTTSNHAPVYPLKVDACLYDAGATLNTVVIYGTLTP